MDFKIIYEDGSVLVIDKPAGIVVFPEGRTRPARAGGEKTVIDYLINKNPELKSVGEGPRYGVAHRLDKNTSGILLVAKKAEALIFLQKQFKNRGVEKKYITLVTGVIKEDSGKIETLIARSPADPRRQKAYAMGEKAPKSAREAITEYKVIQRFQEYTLLEVDIKTGRKHQIRCHLAYIHHPVAGDTMYTFKDSPVPTGLERQFLHAVYLKIRLPNGVTKEFTSELPKELKKTLEKV